MRLFIAFSYDFGSLILLLDSVIDIVSSYGIEASEAGSAELSPMLIIGAIAIDTATISSISTVSICTFFGLFLA